MLGPAAHFHDAPAVEKGLGSGAGTNLELYYVCQQTLALRCTGVQCRRGRKRFPLRYTDRRKKENDRQAPSMFNGAFNRGLP